MTDQELIRALRTNGTKADGCHDCYLGYLAYQAADRLTSLMKDLGRVTRERDAAVEDLRVASILPARRHPMGARDLGKVHGRNIHVPGR